jgi:hypothetical protein
MLQKHHDDTWGQQASGRELFSAPFNGMAAEQLKSSCPRHDGILV